MRYVHQDHLGSTSAITDDTGAAVYEASYDPWGNVRTSTGTAATDRLYTGQRFDAATGLYYYNARYYDPTLARFISPDTIVPGVGDPQAWNRYAYVLGNPMRYVDPTGNDHRSLQDALEDDNKYQEVNRLLNYYTKKGWATGQLVNMWLDIRYGHRRQIALEDAMERSTGRILSRTAAGQQLKDVTNGAIVFAPTGGSAVTYVDTSTALLTTGNVVNHRIDLVRGKTPLKMSYPRVWERAAAYVPDENTIVFDQFDLPIEDRSLKLLMHESAHVNQRLQGTLTSKGQYVMNRGRIEREADTWGNTSTSAPGTTFWVLLP